jgi:Uracil-DNA glycosylase
MYNSMEELYNLSKECRRCKLCVGRTQVVFGDGNINAELMFIGERTSEEMRTYKGFLLLVEQDNL